MKIRLYWNKTINAIHLLLNDKDFYEEVSKKALDNVKAIYHSNVVVNKFKTDFENILIEN